MSKPTTPIVTPTTGGRILRTLVMTVMILVFSVWFTYDGYIGYPQDNVAKMAAALDPVSPELPSLNAKVTKDHAERFIERMKTERVSRQDVVASFGKPGWRNESADDARYFGPGGMLRVSFEGDRVKDAFFQAGEHDDLELAWQRLLGLGLLPVALIMVFQTVRVLSMRVEVNNEGLKLYRRSVIPFAAMTGVDGSAYEKRGFVHLLHSHNSQSRRVRLDEYVIRDFRQVVEAICDRCGFEHPLPPASREIQSDGDGH